MLDELTLLIVAPKAPYTYLLCTGEILLQQKRISLVIYRCTVRHFHFVDHQ
jgi:hypothetical protein